MNDRTDDGIPTILVYATDSTAVEDVCTPLHEAGFAVGRQPLGTSETADFTACRLVIVEGSRQESEALHTCRRLRRLLADAFVPILFVTDNHGPQTRLASFECGADTCLLRPFAAGELRAQVQALLRMKDLHSRLAEKTAEVHRMNRRLQEEYERVDVELELARRIQQSFLPASLPDLPKARFAVRYLPRGRVGGDFYDVFRLDEHRVGFYIADAMGHGIPASLLTIFLKRGVRSKEILGREYRLVPPQEVLQRLNRDLLEQKLPDCPFITMVYGLFDLQSGVMEFSRAGHPYPLYLPAEGPAELWTLEGALLGIFDTDFVSKQHLLAPGDKLLLYTDGCDRMSFDGQPPGPESLRACAERHRHLPANEFVGRVVEDLVHPDEFEDDFTLLALEVKRPAG